MIKTQFELETCHWQEVREQVKRANPELADIIDHINPGKDYPLVRARYPFGANILKQGQLYVPNTDNKIVPLADTSVSPSIQKMLDYSSMPVGFLLNKASEVYLQFDERIVPLNFLPPGELIGTLEMVNSITAENVPMMWNVTAGARTMFMLPKISNARGHKRLRQEFNIQQGLPASRWEHWDVFKSIAEGADSEWESEVLYFSDAWFSDGLQSEEWQRFKNFILLSAWRQSLHKQTYAALSMIWESFSSDIMKKCFRPSHYIVSTLKHLAGIALGVKPGLVVADENEMAGPTNLFERAYAEVYGLDYLPIIMTPSVLNRRKSSFEQTVDEVVFNRRSEEVHRYYSLSTPTLLAGSPVALSKNNVIVSLRELKTIMDEFRVVLKNEYLHFGLGKLSLDYQYFHTESDDKFGILDGKGLMSGDARFERLEKAYPKHEFPANCAFIRGCVRID